MASLNKEETPLNEINILVAGQVDAGKCLHGSTKVMMADCSIQLAKDIKIGDLLMGDDSLPRKVLSTSIGHGTMYNVEQTEGDSYIVNKHHILSLKRTNVECIEWDQYNQAWNCRYWVDLSIAVKIFLVSEYGSVETARYEALRYLKKIAPTLSGYAKAYDIVDIAVETYMKLPADVCLNLRGYKVGLEFEEREILISPYTLGFWLGQPTSSCSLICESVVREYNLAGERCIPDDFKFNTRQIRLEILAGILDVSGSILDNLECCTIEQKSELFIDDIIFLCKSLGLLTFKTSFMRPLINSSTYTIEQYYQVALFGNINAIPRKILCRETSDKITGNVLLTEINIIPINKDYFYGIQLDGNQRFLLHDFTVTHNSSTIGVLVYNELDTPDNPICKRVDKHRHEQESKHTSSISSHYMKKDNRVVGLVNLCGHLKYLKQTLFGMNGYYADYSCLLVNINRGITEMGLEHLSILVHLSIPFFIILTKIDSCVNVDMYKKAHEQIHKTLRKFGRKAISLRVDREYNLTEDYYPYIDFLAQKAIISPIFCASNRTGKNVDKIRDFIFELKSRLQWQAEDIVNDIFIITAVYNVPHVGLILSGIVKAKVDIMIADTWYIGSAEGKFLPVKIKSIHNDVRQDVNKLANGESGCLRIKFAGKDILTRGQIIRGMILTNNPIKILSSIVEEFIAKVIVLHHHTTIKTNYECMIHMGPITQTAVLTCLEGIDTLRTGDTAMIKFTWKFRPEYIEIGTKFFAREGSCRIAGEVISLPIKSVNMDK